MARQFLRFGTKCIVPGSRSNKKQRPCAKTLKSWGTNGPNSNYKMLSEKVKEIKASIPVKSIKRQQKRNEYEQLFVCPKCGSRIILHATIILVVLVCAKLIT